MITIVPFLQRVDAVILNPLLEVLFAVACIYFVYSVIRLINADGSDKSEARRGVMWGIVGMFIMISVYGIISLILTTFDISPNSSTFIQDKIQTSL